MCNGGEGVGEKVDIPAGFTSDYYLERESKRENLPSGHSNLPSRVTREYGQGFGVTWNDPT